MTPDEAWDSLIAGVKDAKETPKQEKQMALAALVIARQACVDLHVIAEALKK